jgi:hypothetical protein
MLRELILIAALSGFSLNAAAANEPPKEATNTPVCAGMQPLFANQTSPTQGPVWVVQNQTPNGPVWVVQQERPAKPLS